MKTKKLTISNGDKEQTFVVSEDESVPELLNEISKDLYKQWYGTEHQHLLTKMEINMVSDAVHDPYWFSKSGTFQYNRTYELIIDGERAFTIREEFY